MKPENRSDLELAELLDIGRRRILELSAQLALSRRRELILRRHMARAQQQAADLQIEERDLAEQPVR